MNRSGLDFLVLVLQSSNSFLLNAFFNFASVYFVLVKWYMFSFCLWGLVFLFFVIHTKTGIFDFFCLKSSNGYQMKPMFSVDLSFFVFLLNDGALNLLWHDVAGLSVSFTVSRATATKSRMSMSRLDFMVLVLQNSNSFDLNSLFFSSFVEFNFSWLQSPSPFVAFRGPYVSRNCFV